MSQYSFPEKFQFGVATSSYQIEGAWNEGGRSESIWDYHCHNRPEVVIDRSNGDISCDSYHRWKEDVELIKGLGVNFYRFSISWSRVLPLATKDSPVNEEGAKYYSNLIDGLLAAGIEPCITMFHWDTPQILETKGGWLNENIIEDFVYYAKTLFTLYGDRVKNWITFNEFSQICEEGYSTGEKAPFINLQGIGGYQSFHNCVLAHGRTYRMYEKEFKPVQKGKISVSINSFHAANKTDSETDKLAAEKFMLFNYGWFTHPILIGNYPPAMIERIDELSKKQGFEKSRLPKFTEEQIEMIKGSFDYLGLNHYTTFLCTFGNGFPEPSQKNDCGVVISTDPLWKKAAVPWLSEVPWGLRKLLVWIKHQFKNPPILITENGWGTSGKTLEDIDRINYMKGYLAELLKAIHEDGCNVIGYTAWSLMDNFEWTDGYTAKFGLVHVDFDSPERTRTPKKSYHTYRRIIQTKRLDDA